MRTYRAWFLVISIVIILALTAYFLVITFQTIANRTLEPLESGTRNLETQIAQLTNPTPTILPDPVTIIRDVRTLARLETIQYSVEKVITAESSQGPFASLFGDKLIFVAHGRVIAGVDLQKLTADDISVEKGVVSIQLPPAEVFTSTLDNDKSYVYDRETGLLTHGDVNLETSARQAAEEEILTGAIEDGILDQAQLNAENYLDRLLRDLGYVDVIFIPTSATTPQP